MSEFELNTRYKLDTSGIDLTECDAQLVTMQYSFLPDAITDKSAVIAISGENAVITISREEYSDDEEVVLKGNVTSAPADSVLIFDSITKEFRLINSRMSIKGLKRDRKNKFSDVTGYLGTSSIDVSKRLKAVASSKRKKDSAASSARQILTTGNESLSSLAQPP